MLMNEHYQIVPDYLMADLCGDLQQLLFADVAATFRLVFYNPIDINDIYLEKSYRVAALGYLGADRPQDLKVALPTPFEFDIFIYFTKRFLALPPKAKEALVSECHLKWFDFSKEGIKASCEEPDEAEGETDENRDEPEEEARSEESPDEFKVLSPLEVLIAQKGKHQRDSVKPERVQTLQHEERPATIKVEANLLRQESGSEPVPRVEDPAQIGHGSALQAHFSKGKSLMIAAYVDSRKLIGDFIGAAGGLGLTPVQWTYAEGFKVLNDRYANRYLLHDDGFSFVNKRLSPFDALRYIRQEAKPRTIYLLEDFHYYIKEENVAGSDFAELISVLKSLPEILRKAGSYLVILAPTVELPPEIAPIFEIIKEQKGPQELHYLARFGTDLTKLVLSGKIKPVVGRDREIFDCLKILAQMETNNPLLVGKSGVGKTAIVEGLAAALVKNNAPRAFCHKRIIALNLNQMLSGTKYRGEFEKRLEGLLEEVRANAQNVIVFIDEIHTLLGMGQTEGSQGAENILKPVLARGEFPCIGATTFDEYKRHIAPDKALDRRFQMVNVAEPSRDETLTILKGVKHVYENHHRVTIHINALDKCVELAENMLPNEFFPGKAIKMLDSVCASASLTGNAVVTPVYVAEEFLRMHGGNVAKR